MREDGALELRELELVERRHVQGAGIDAEIDVARARLERAEAKAFGRSGRLEHTRSAESHHAPHASRPDGAQSRSPACRDGARRARFVSESLREACETHSRYAHETIAIPGGAPTRPYSR